MSKSDCFKMFFAVIITILCQSCLGIHMVSNDTVQKDIHAVSETEMSWIGEYTGTIQFDDNVNNDRFSHDLDIPASISDGKTITAELSLKKIPDYAIISVKTQDGSTNWDFTVDSSFLSSLSVEFNSSIQYLGKKRNCTVTIKLDNDILSGQVVIQPTESIVYSAWTQHLVRSPGGLYILNFTKERL